MRNRQGESQTAEKTKTKEFYIIPLISVGFPRCGVLSYRE